MSSKATKWADLPGYKGLYQVSVSGMVRSLTTDRTISVQRVGTPAARVRLSRDGVERSVRVSALVAMAKRAFGAQTSQASTRRAKTARTSR